MSSLLKWIIGGIVALIVLIAVVVICLLVLIDPNDYKDRIAQTVQEQTGRELSIPGDIKLSISPGLKAVFKLGDVNMSSSKEFQGTDFFSSQLVEINLALWPLIKSKTLQINNIGLKGVNVNLVRNSSGVANWEDLAGGEKKGKPRKTPDAMEKQPEAKPAKALPKLDIGGINVTDINLTFTDQQAGRTVKLSNFNLNVGHIMENKPFPVDANFAISIDDGKRPLSAATGLSTNLTFDLARQVYLMDRLKLTTDISGAPVPVKFIGLDMNAEADLGKSLFNISDLLVKIDDTSIKGTTSITDLQKPIYTAKLHIDQLDLDRYQPEHKPAAQQKASTEKAMPPSKPVTTGGAPTQPQSAKKDQPIIPVDLLRGLNFDAEIRIDKLIAANLVTTNVLIKATGKEGLVQLQPFSADLYQGTIAVNGDIDARPNMPEMKLTKTLKGVEMGPMFMDLKGKEEVKGTADIKINVSTRGNTKTELIRNSNGTMKLELANGEIAKLKIIDTIRIAKRLYEGGSEESATTASRDKKKSGRPTSFADLSATGIITNGVFTNEDLLAQSELMKVTGKGKVNLNTEEIDYLLTIYLAKKLERDDEKDLVEMSDTPIPYKVTGTFEKIDQSAALGEVLKAGAVKLISKELEKQLGGDSEGGDKKGSSTSTEDLINKGLKSLFGK